MRHRVRAGVLGRSPSHRLAMYRNLVTSLLEHERIETTDAKAKGVRRLAERMITLGKRGDLHARRRALRVIRSRKVAAKVFDDLADRFRTRPGGYTRVVKVGHRAGDGAAISVVELVEGPSAKSAKQADSKGKAAVKTVPKKKAASKKKEPAEKPKKKAVSSSKTAAAKTPSKKKTAKKTTGKKTTGKKTASKKTTNKKK